MYLFFALTFAVARCQESKLTMDTVPAAPHRPSADSVVRDASQSEMRLWCCFPGRMPVGPMSSVTS